MYCRNCNLQYPNSSLFCNVCGGALEAPAVAVQAPKMAPQEETYTDQDGVQYVLAKPRSKKKIIAIVLAALVSVGLIVGLICYLVMINNPLYQISNALDNTIDELLVNTPTLSNVKENVSELISDRAFTAKVDYTYTSYDYDYNYSKRTQKGSGKIELNYDASGEEMSGKASISVYEDEEYGDTYSKSFDLDFSADDDDIYARLKQLDRDIYSLPLSNFGEEYTGSSLSKLVDEDDLNDFLEKAEFNPYADVSFSAFRNTDAGEEFIDSLHIEESDKEIPHTDDLTVYSIELRAKDLSKAMLAYYEWALTEICGEEAVKELDFPKPEKSKEVIYIYLGINDDDCLVALYAYPKGDKDDAVTIVLEGKENIWDDVVIYNGNDETKIFIEQQDDGFEVYLKHDDRSPEKLLEVDDGDQELIIYDGSSSYELKYSDEDNGAKFELSYKDSSESIDFEISILPVQDIEMLDGDPVAVLEMKKSKLEDLLEEAEEVLD